MKIKYELSVTMRGDDGTWDLMSFDKIMADSLVSLLGQFLIVVGRMHQLEMDEHTKMKLGNDDDIPF